MSEATTATRTVLETVAVASAPGPAGAAGIDERTAALRPAPADVVRAAVAAGLAGPLRWAVGQGIVELDAPALEQLETAHLGGLGRCLVIESRLWSILDWLEGTGVRPLVVKGPAVAHLDEDDPALREFSDLDLLVASDDLDVVLGVLGSRGAVRPYAERRRGFDRRFAKSVTVTFPDHVEIDVHRTICDGVHAVRVPVDRLHRSPSTFDLGGRTVHAPDRTVRALHAAYHAVLGSPSPRLRSVRDLVGYLGRAEVDGTVDELIEEAERWGGTAVLAQAVRETLLPGVELPRWEAWLAETPIAPDEAAIVAAQRRDGSSFRASRLAAARELPTIGDRSAYLLAAAVPGTRHLRSRGRSRLDALRPGAPTGRTPVVLPDLPRARGARRGPRTLVVLPFRSLRPDRHADPMTGTDTWAPADAQTGPVHLLVRAGGDRWRDRLWRDGRTATVVELPGGHGWRRRLHRAAVASGEVRRFDPDRVVVGARSLPLLLPALVVGRRRDLAVTEPDNLSVPVRLLLARHRRPAPDTAPAPTPTPPSAAREEPTPGPSSGAEGRH